MFDIPGLKFSLSTARAFLRKTFNFHLSPFPHAELSMSISQKNLENK